MPERSRGAADTDRNEEQHSVAVAAVVTDERARVLLMQRRDHGNWEPPGGALKVGEFVEDGLRREVKEETGVEIDVGPVSGVYENPRQGVLSLVFKCALREGAAVETTEASDVRWVSPEDVRSLLNRDYARWVSDALQGGPPRVRNQQDTIKGASSSPHRSV